jgi:hypothetical protein
LASPTAKIAYPAKVVSLNFVRNVPTCRHNSPPLAKKAFPAAPHTSCGRPSLSRGGAGFTDVFVTGMLISWENPAKGRFHMRRHITAKFPRSLLVLAFLFSVFCARPALTYGQAGTAARSTAGSAARLLTLYRTEQQAQNHCPKDTVVWLDHPSGIYHFKGQRQYGNTNDGAFVCEHEADQAGNRAAQNGQ